MARKTRNPYGATKKRAAALAWMAAHGIDQPRGTVRAVTVGSQVSVTVVPVLRLAHRITNVRNIR